MDAFKKRMLQAAGFKAEVALVEEGVCPTCRKLIKKEEFKDELSVKEFGISGMCQACQDEVFKTEEE